MTKINEYVKPTFTKVQKKRFHVLVFSDKLDLKKDMVSYVDFKEHGEVSSSEEKDYINIFTRRF
jgi:hypothetical protein